MVNPQKENGYTAIANEILERIVATPLLAGELRLLFFVLRKTYGYQKKEDRISLTQFEKGLKLSRPTVSKYLKNLKARNILVATPLLAIKFNKDWDSWVVDTPLLVKNKKKPSSYAPTENGSPAPTHKRKKEKTKERIQAEQAPQDIVLLIDKFSVINPACKKMYSNTTQRKACQFLVDTYGLERVMGVIEKTLPKTNGLQFFPTITTPVQLQDKWSTLEASIIKFRAEKPKRYIA